MIKQATLHNSGSLVDFIDLKSGHKHTITVDFELNPSAKDLIEAQGIPHTAIFGLKINGQQETLDYNVQQEDRVRPVPFEMINPEELNPIFVSPSKFIADVHLGKLARNLRLLGFDTLMDENYSESEIINISNTQKRMILSRDIGLLRHGDASFGYWIRNTDPKKQAQEIFDRFEISEMVNPFSRCMKCNGELGHAPLSDVKSQVPPKVQEWHSEFYHCSKCGKVYWKGSHYKKLKEKVARLTSK